MVLTKKQSNKIKVAETTEVAYINGEKIYAENLQKWAYRRLETWPELLATCKLAHENLSPKGGIKKDYSGHVAMSQLSRAIANAE